MALAVRDPFTSLIKQLDTDFDLLTRRAFGVNNRAGAFVPPADVHRDGEDVVITLELPGVDTDGVDVEVSERKLTVSGRREAGTEDGAVFRELRGGEFRREFRLPEGVTGDNVEADYDRGLLRVRVRGVVRKPVEPAKIKVRGIEGGAVS
ncbi:Hsp20/alpha crystallin family protein [Allokutzneria sp. A3M-2-11 16]|uniref:Hsp20/alpha crystallin family protein n=1 Tax=Allokutzneria sp. A3M-2-11 16 TaxID=2962043 RepID=UPI0020B66843|nr:Hsp20/alpha crystallin family protein [Allokutzneria sp. A3M-2-11 16]MCP3799637.1 Hsp20/alpha crystallin family protein [Allokutzneria sp. A3M-2-11 16]